MIIETAEIKNRHVLAMCTATGESAIVEMDSFYKTEDENIKFKVIGLKTKLDPFGPATEVILEQVGYWTNQLRDTKQLTDLIGTAIERITDKDEIKAIEHSSRYC